MLGNVVKDDRHHAVLGGIGHAFMIIGAVRPRLVGGNGEQGAKCRDNGGGSGEHSNSPQGECDSKHAGAAALHAHKPRQSRKRRNRRMAGDVGDESL